MEGPGVLVIKRRLSFLIGSKVIAIVGNSKTPKEVLLNRTLTDIFSQGKELFLVFDDVAVRIHFLMYGSYSINREREGKVPRISATFMMPEGKEVCVNFYNTSVRFLASAALPVNSSVDILSEKFNIRQAVERIKSSPRIISDILLDQSAFAGVGNIIKNEALFLAKIHPESVGFKIPEEMASELVNKILFFSKVFLEFRQKNRRLREVLTVYNRKYCPLCGGRISIKYIGESRRRTFYCNSCQILY